MEPVNEQCTTYGPSVGTDGEIEKLVRFETVPRRVTSVLVGFSSMIACVIVEPTPHCIGLSCMGGAGVAVSVMLYLKEHEEHEEHEEYTNVSCYFSTCITAIRCIYTQYDMHSRFDSYLHSYFHSYFHSRWPLRWHLWWHLRRHSVSFGFRVSCITYQTSPRSLLPKTTEPCSTPATRGEKSSS